MLFDLPVALYWWLWVPNWDQLTCLTRENYVSFLTLGMLTLLVKKSRPGCFYGECCQRGEKEKHKRVSWDYKQSVHGKIRPHVIAYSPV